MKWTARRPSSIQGLLWLALVLALAGSLRHVAWTFASLDGNDVMGWVQAVAVDVGLASLTLALMQRRRFGVGVQMLMVGIGVFIVISIYANLVYGLAHQLKELPQWVQASRPWVLAATLPALVLYLADVLGSNIEAQQRKADREQRAEERQHEVKEQPPPASYFQCADCGRGFDKDNRHEYIAHRRWCPERAVAGNGRKPITEVVND